MCTVESRSRLYLWPARKSRIKDDYFFITNKETVVGSDKSLGVALTTWWWHLFDEDRKLPWQYLLVSIGLVPEARLSADFVRVSFSLITMTHQYFWWLGSLGLKFHADAVQYLCRWNRTKPALSDERFIGGSLAHTASSPCHSPSPFTRCLLSRARVHRITRQRRQRLCWPLPDPPGRQWRATTDQWKALRPAVLYVISPRWINRLGRTAAIIVSKDSALWPMGRAPAPHFPPSWTSERVGLHCCCRWIIWTCQCQFSILMDVFLTQRFFQKRALAHRTHK